MLEKLKELVQEVKEVLKSFEYKWKLFKGVVSLNYHCDTKHFKCKCQQDMKITLDMFKKVSLLEIIPESILEIIKTWYNVNFEEVKELLKEVKLPAIYKQFINDIEKYEFSIVYKDYTLTINTKDEAGNFITLIIDNDLIGKIATLIYANKNLTDDKDVEKAYEIIKDELPKWLIDIVDSYEE